MFYSNIVTLLIISVQIISKMVTLKKINKYDVHVLPNRTSVLLEVTSQLNPDTILLKRIPLKTRIL